MEVFVPFTIHIICYQEVASYEDGTEFTYVTTTSSQGMTTRISGSSGYIGSVYWERVQPTATGQ